MTLSHLFRTASLRSLKGFSLSVTVCLILAVNSWGQSSPAQPQTPPAPPQPQQPPSPAQPQTTPPSGSSAQQVPGAGATVQAQQGSGSDSQQGEQNSDQPEPETHITKQQAKDLFRSV